MKYLHAVIRGSMVGGVVATLALIAAAQSLPIVFEDDFEAGMDRWQATDRDLEESVWKIETLSGVEGDNKVLRVNGKSAYQPPYRSPHSIAWLKEVEVGSFQIDVRLMNTRPDAGPHRDLCIFWGGQDAAHFYYVHLGARADPHACQIFIVDGAARKAITTVEAKGTEWTNGWHKARVTFDAKGGAIRVYFDDLVTPLMQANDKTFAHGRVGLGTFDDHGNFDDFVLRANPVVQ